MYLRRTIKDNTNKTKNGVRVPPLSEGKIFGGAV